MSSLLNMVGNSIVGFMFTVDVRLNNPMFRNGFWIHPIGLSDDGANPGDVADFVTDFWPGGASLLGASGVDVAVLEAIQWGRYDPISGDASRFGFVGTTRDQYGTPVGSVTLRLFRTANNVLIDTATSDPTGRFLLNTPYYPDTHYIVAHKSGSPDIDGVTVNTLIGT